MSAGEGSMEEPHVLAIFPALEEVRIGHRAALGGVLVSYYLLLGWDRVSPKLGVWEKHVGGGAALLIALGVYLPQCVSGGGRSQ
jgi:hypothetical protein